MHAAGQVRCFVHQHMEANGTEQFQFFPYPAAEMVVVSQNRIDSVFAFYILQRFIAFLTQHILQVIVHLVAAKKNHICILAVNKLCQFCRVLPAKQGPQMDIRHQHDFHRPWKILSGIMFHCPYNRMQGVPAAVNKNCHYSNKSRFCIKGVCLLPESPIPPEQPDNPQYQVQNTRIGRIMEKSQPVPAQKGKRPYKPGINSKRRPPYVDRAKQQRQTQKETQNKSVV